MSPQVKGTIPEIISNARGLYEGDLKDYFRVIFYQTQNLRNPYHNLRHTLHVTWLCHEACIFYQDTLHPRHMRDLLIAAMFHDFNHPGFLGDDDLNIERAIRALNKHLLPEDIKYRDSILSILRCTQYPYVVESENLLLAEQIIRDADMGQCFSVAWVQQVVVGLASEWRKEPIDVLRLQVDFLQRLTFHTEWGKKTFPQSLVKEKLEEVYSWIDLL